MSRTFSPAVKMDRAMLVTVLYRMDGSTAVSGSVPFTDIKTGSYYNNALVWAYQRGIIQGTSATEFSPTTYINREMMVTIFFRYAQYLGRDVSKFDWLSSYTDAHEIASYALTALQWAVANGHNHGQYRNHTAAQRHCKPCGMCYRYKALLRVERKREQPARHVKSR